MTTRARAAAPARRLRGPTGARCSRRCWPRSSWRRGPCCGLWSASPYGRYLDHGGWGDAGALAALCRAVPQGDIVVPAVLHARGLGADDRGDDAADDVSAARDVPAHRRGAAGRRTARRRSSSLGFFVAWLAFGLLAHAADALLLRWRAARRRGSSPTAGSIGAAVLAGAGPVPVQRAQVPLPRAMPHAVRLRRRALARPRRRRARRCGSASTTASSASAAAGR